MQTLGEGLRHDCLRAKWLQKFPNIPSNDERRLTKERRRQRQLRVSLPMTPYHQSCWRQFVASWTLCTARLVCPNLREAASRFFHSVQLSVEDLRSRPETNLNNFPNLSRVSICDMGNHDHVMLAQSSVADAVTHIRAVQYTRELGHGQIAARAYTPPFPNLVSLTVVCAANFTLLFPPTLRELILEAPVTYETAVLLTRLTSLTCLRLDVEGMLKPFEAVTALTRLKRLEICSELSLFPFVAQLTLLTHLQSSHPWEKKMPADRVRLALAALPRLQRLVHLGVGPVWVSTELIAGIGTITSLRSLALGLRGRRGGSAFRRVCMTPFSQLTALRLGCRGLDTSFLPWFNLERLQDLSLSYGVELDGVEVAALREATGLTHLQLWTSTVGATVGPEQLGIALAQMSQLRALSFATNDSSELAICSQAVGLLTGLTRLEWGGRGFTPNSAVQACLGLKKLRVLKLMWGSAGARSSSSECITPETFIAVAMLPELSTFNVSRMIRISGWDLKEFLDYTWVRVKADRHDKGWPPLMLTVDRH